jgi:hypothetical protein
MFDDEVVIQVSQILLSNQPKEQNNPMVPKTTSYCKITSFLS